MHKLRHGVTKEKEDKVSKGDNLLNGREMRGINYLHLCYVMADEGVPSTWSSNMRLTQISRGGVLVL